MNASRDAVGVTRALKQLNVSFADDLTINGNSANLKAAQEANHAVRSCPQAESGEEVAIELLKIDNVAGMVGEPTILHQSDSIRSEGPPTEKQVSDHHSPGKDQSQSGNHPSVRPLVQYTRIGRLDAVQTRPY